MNQGPHRGRTELDDAADGVSRYVKLAMIFRHKISSGEWQIDSQVPTIDALVEQYNVARVTVRQAVGILSSEGLVVSQRGKGTFVRGIPQGPDQELTNAISDPLSDSPDLQIEILEKRSVKTLPSDLMIGARRAESYVLLKKIHRLKGRPFSYMEIYIAKEIFASIPKGAEKKSKISRLLRLSGKDNARGFIRQSIAVCPADYDIARRLDYAFAAPLARIRRWTFDHNACVIMAGVYWYRGDHFALEFDLPIETYLRHPSMVFPDTRDE